MSAKNDYPYWYYDYVVLIDGSGNALGPQYITHELKNGYNYMIRGFLISWPHSTAVAGSDMAPDLSMELIQYERNRPIMEEPIPIELFATPGGNFPVAGLNDNLSRPLGRSFIAFDCLLSNRDNLLLRVTGQRNVPTIGGEPDFVRIVTVGRNVRNQ